MGHGEGGAGSSNGGAGSGEASGTTPSGRTAAGTDNSRNHRTSTDHGGAHASDDHGSTNDDYGRACSGHQLRPPTNNIVGKCQAAIQPAARLSEHQPRHTQLHRLITNFVAL